MGLGDDPTSDEAILYYRYGDKRKDMQGNWTFEHKDSWHRKYKDCMIAEGLTEEEAQNALDAGMGEYDYSDDPEEAALMEMSYWTD